MDALNLPEFLNGIMPLIRKPFKYREDLADISDKLHYARFLNDKNSQIYTPVNQEELEYIIPYLIGLETVIPIVVFIGFEGTFLSNYDFSRTKIQIIFFPEAGGFVIQSCIFNSDLPLNLSYYDFSGLAIGIESTVCTNFNFEGANLFNGVLETCVLKGCDFTNVQGIDNDTLTLAASALLEPYSFTGVDGAKITIAPREPGNPGTP